MLAEDRLRFAVPPAAGNSTALHATFANWKPVSPVIAAESTQVGVDADAARGRSDCPGARVVVVARTAVVVVTATEVVVVDGATVVVGLTGFVVVVGIPLDTLIPGGVVVGAAATVVVVVGAATHATVVVVCPTAVEVGAGDVVVVGHP